MLYTGYSVLMKLQQFCLKLLQEIFKCTTILGLIIFNNYCMNVH